MAVKYENQIWEELAGVIQSALAKQGITEFAVKPGTPDHKPDGTPEIILHKTLETPVGSQSVHDFTDDATGLLVHEESYLIELTFAATAYKKRDDATAPAAFTASDALQAVMAYLLSPNGIRYLKALGYGILPVKEIVQTYVVDEDGAYQITPSFNFTVCIKQSRRSPVAELVEQTYTITPI